MLIHTCSFAASMSRPLQRVFVRGSRSFHREAGPTLPNLTMKKEDMQKLPRFTPPNKVYLIDSKWDQARSRTVIRKALNARVVGFDTESPIPETGCAPYAPSVVQISTLDEALVWKLTGLWHLPDSLREILEGDAIKVGHASKEDAVLLLRHYCIDTQNIADTYALAETLGLPHLRLQHLVGAFLGQYLPKGHTLSNWRARELSPAQINYAACDAYASLKLYYAMEEYCSSIGAPSTQVVPNALSLLHATTQRYMASALHQINYLSQKKNHFSHLLREQQSAISQIVRELRAVRGSLGVIDALHEELQAATDDSSNVTFTTPYYSYLVKRLPMENGVSEGANRSEPPRQYNGAGKTRSHQSDTSPIGVNAINSLTDRDTDITKLENSEDMAADISTTSTAAELKEDDREQEVEGEEEEEEVEEEKEEKEEEVNTPVRSRWWLWMSGSETKS